MRHIELPWLGATVASAVVAYVATFAMESQLAFAAAFIVPFAAASWSPAFPLFAFIHHGPPMKPSQDAYGHLMLDHFEGRPAVEIVERDDGMIMVNRGPMMYFEPIRRWPQPESAAMRLVRGKVLDVGCGPGRVALHLQQRGFEVLGIDLSPGAVRVAKARGLRKARVMALDDVGPRLGLFDTIVMFGNNFGLFESRGGAVRRLGRLSRVTTEAARILASSRDPYKTADPIHLAYHRSNKARGRMGGQLRLRIRHRKFATPWFDYLLVSPAEMEQLAAEAGWRLARTIGDGEQYYVGVLEKRQ